jgi:hypothetical protein
MVRSTVYPNVYVIQSCSLWKTLVVLQFAKSYKLILKKLKIVEKKKRNKRRNLFKTTQEISN